MVTDHIIHTTVISQIVTGVAATGAARSIDPGGGVR
jgi:hypothetical protein